MKAFLLNFVLILLLISWNEVSSETADIDDKLSGPHVCKRIVEWVENKSFRKKINLLLPSSRHITEKYVTLFRYPVEVVVTEKQAYQERVNNWCFGFPPRCSTFKIKFRTVTKTQTITKSDIKRECCGLYWMT